MPSRRQIKAPQRSAVQRQRRKLLNVTSLDRTHLFHRWLLWDALHLPSIGRARAPRLTDVTRNDGNRYDTFNGVFFINLRGRLDLNHLKRENLSSGGKSCHNLFSVHVIDLFIMMVTSFENRECFASARDEIRVYHMVYAYVGRTVCFENALQGIVRRWQGVLEPSSFVLTKNACRNVIPATIGGKVQFTLNDHHLLQKCLFGNRKFSPVLGDSIECVKNGQRCVAL